MTRRTRYGLLAAVVAIGLGGSPADATEPRPAPDTHLKLVEGSRVKTANKTTVYFVDGGRLRPMRYAAYKNLFSGWGGIKKIKRAPKALLGMNMRGDTRLVRIRGEERVWFIDNGREKRLVTTFHGIGFSSRLVELVEPEELDPYYEGPPVGRLEDQR